VSLFLSMWPFRKNNIPDDEQLLRAYYGSGDKHLVGQLFERHSKTVYGVCLYYFKDKENAKDAVMQIFEKLIVELRKSKVQNFKAWLSFVVRNYCLNEIRKNKGRYFLPEAYLDFELKPAVLDEEERIQSVTEDLMLTHMESALKELKENQRTCVELFYLKGKSYDEIAESTSFSMNEVKSFIQNGKRNLKLLIEAKLKIKNNAA